MAGNPVDCVLGITHFMDRLLKLKNDMEAVNGPGSDMYKKCRRQTS
jgi:hypothetical protein